MSGSEQVIESRAAFVFFNATIDFFCGRNIVLHERSATDDVGYSLEELYLNVTVRGSSIPNAWLISLVAISDVV